RCGLGTVMGAKRLKAVACGGKAAIKLEDKDTFREIARKQIELLDESLLKVGFDAFGTNMLSDMVNARGGYPTRNWQEGVFEGIEEVNGQTLTDKVFVKGVNCFACPISCGRGTEIREGPWEGHRGEGPEYETVNT
ncbi:aldehyde ferredoxin oxidoreductase, partial [Desulfobacteraceae bacterium SEEP-SAG9]